MTTEEARDDVPIGEKVRFWEEQDRINKELIPRVVRQHELLTRHIAEHESLPEVVANAVHKAANAVREEQKQAFESEVALIRNEIEQQVKAAILQAAQGVERKAEAARRVTIGIAGGAAAVAIAAILLSIVTLMGD